MRYDGIYRIAAAYRKAVRRLDHISVFSRLATGQTRHQHYGALPAVVPKCCKHAEFLLIVGCSCERHLPCPNISIAARCPQPAMLVQGNQGKLVCRYLFMRSDNEPAPWASDGLPAWTLATAHGLLLPQAGPEEQCCSSQGSRSQPARWPGMLHWVARMGWP